MTIATKTTARREMCRLRGGMSPATENECRSDDGARQRNGEHSECGMRTDQRPGGAEHDRCKQAPEARRRDEEREPRGPALDGEHAACERHQHSVGGGVEDPEREDDDGGLRYPEARNDQS